MLAAAHGTVLSLLQAESRPGYGLPAREPGIEATVDVLVGGMRY